MKSSKFKLTNFFDKIVMQCKYPYFERCLKVSGRYTKECKSHCSSKFGKTRYIRIAAAMLVGKKECPPAHFPCNIIQNSPASLAYNFVFVGPNSFKFDTNTCYMVLYTMSKFGGN